MKNLKKVSLGLLLAASLCAMTACGEDNTTKDDNKNTGTENAVDKNNNDSTAPNVT